MFFFEAYENDLFEGLYVVNGFFFRFSQENTFSNKVLNVQVISNTD